VQSLRWWTWGVVYQVYSALLWPTHICLYYFRTIYAIREKFDKVNKGETNRSTSVCIVNNFFSSLARRSSGRVQDEKIVVSCINYFPCNHQFLIFANNNTIILLHTILNTIIHNVIHSVWPWARVKSIYFLCVSNLWILYLDFETDVFFRNIIVIIYLILLLRSFVWFYRT